VVKLKINKVEFRLLVYGKLNKDEVKEV